MRFVLCRPIGGLNDMLCQIEKCCRYAETYGRRVVVQTDGGFHPSFQLCLGHYLISMQERLVFAEALGEGFFEGLSVQPRSLQGRLSETDFLPARGIGLRDRVSGDLISFDFMKEHAEDVLVHNLFGGGDDAFSALARVRLHDAVADEIVARIGEMGAGYPAVHVRHTDMRSEYESVLQELQRCQFDRLFLATDNGDVVKDFRSRLRGTVIYSFSDLPEQAGQPVHRLRGLNRSDRHRLNQQAFVDLLLLALSDRLFLCQREDGRQPGGFSRLAMHLHEDRAAAGRLVHRDGLVTDQPSSGAGG
jgi:hypothetical protein